MIHARFLDTAFNTVATVMMNIYQSFVLTGMKCFRYIKSLPTAKQPHVSLVISTNRATCYMIFKTDGAIQKQSQI